MAGNTEEEEFLQYTLHDVVINPLPTRQMYIDVFNQALASNTDTELEAATEANWKATPYRLWVLAFARELKAYAKRDPFLVPFEFASHNNRYQSVSLLTEKNEAAQHVLYILFREAINCITEGYPGFQDPGTEVHLVIATVKKQIFNTRTKELVRETNPIYAGHITYYDTPNPYSMHFIAIYKSVYCKICKRFSDILLNKIESVARARGKKYITTSPIGPMTDILAAHGFGAIEDVGTTAKMIGGKRMKRRSTRSQNRSRRNRR